MIIKVQNDRLQDRFLVEAAYIRWDYINGDAILEVYVVSTQSKKVGPTSIAFTRIEEEPSLRLRVYNGDRVFIMNNDGKTIDSKHIIVGPENKRQNQ